MSPCPIISVLMPVYNVEKYVGEAIESVLGQTFDDFEFVIVDDGSTDRTVDICRQYAARDPRIVLLHDPARGNRGITPTLNEGLRHCRGEFIARIDADDLAMPERFEKQVAYLRAHPECVCLGTGRVDIGDDGADLRVCALALRHEAIVSNILHGKADGMTHVAVMMRRDAVEAVGGYDEFFRVAQDRDLWLRLARRGRLANLPDLLTKVRCRNEGITRTRRPERLRYMREAARRHFARQGRRMPRFFQVGSPPYPSASRRWRGRTWEALDEGRRVRAVSCALCAIATNPLFAQNWWTLAVTAKALFAIRRTNEKPTATAPSSARVPEGGA